MDVIKHGVAFLAAFFGAGLAFPQERAAIPVITVCEALRSLDVYRGRPVVVVGRWDWTFEGTFIHEECESDGLISIHGRRWASLIEVGTSRSRNSQSAGEREFPADETVLWRKLSELSGFAEQKTTDSWGNWGAIYGEIESPNPLRQKLFGLGYSGNGYGANGTVPASIKAIQTKTLIRGRQFVVQKSPLPDLPEPPTISVQPPSASFPDVLLAAPAIVPATGAPKLK